MKIYLHIGYFRSEILCDSELLLVSDAKVFDLKTFKKREFWEENFWKLLFSSIFKEFYFDSKSVEKAHSRNPPERFRQLESLFIKKKFEVKTSALSTCNVCANCRWRRVRRSLIRFVCLFLDLFVRPVQATGTEWQTMRPTFYYDNTIITFFVFRSLSKAAAVFAKNVFLAGGFSWWIFTKKFDSKLLIKTLRSFCPMFFA